MEHMPATGLRRYHLGPLPSRHIAKLGVPTDSISSSIWIRVEAKKIDTAQS